MNRYFALTTGTFEDALCASEYRSGMIYRMAPEGKIMNDTSISKERLEMRRDEINAQLGKLSKDEQIELDRDSEEQAIQLEQHEVSVALVENLRRELADIEDRLLNL